MNLRSGIHGTDTNLVEGREFLLDVRFTELNVHHLCTILYLAVMASGFIQTIYEARHP